MIGLRDVWVVLKRQGHVKTRKSANSIHAVCCSKALSLQVVHTDGAQRSRALCAVLHDSRVDCEL